MTAPSYTEDLDDLTLADEGSGWAESTDGAWDDQGPPAYQDQDYAYIQGSYSITADTTKTGTGTLLWDYGSTFTIATDGAMLVWLNFYNPNALDTYANGGLRAIIGSGLGTFYSWDVGGSDFGKYPYGGWQNFAVNDTVSPDDTVNSYAGGSHQYIGGGCKVLTGIGKGESFQVDAIRKGRCSAIFEYGETADYCTFAGFAAVNDATTARWGLIQAIPGGFLWKGRMSLGTASNACDFRDENFLILLDSTPKVTTNFNTIELIHTSSNVEWTNFSIICVDPTNTASRGRFITTNDAPISWVGGTLVDMGTFTFDSNADISTTTFRRCDLITTGGGDFDLCTFDETNDSTKAVLCASPAEAALITNSTFNSTGTGHGLEIGGTAASITLTGLVFSGYDTSDPGTAANKAIFVNIATGTMTITISGGSGVSEDYHVRSAGATVTISADTTITFSGLKDNSEVRIYKVSDDSVVAGIEDATAGTEDNRTFSWAAPNGTEVYYRIHCFEPGDEIYETVFVSSYTVPANDTTIDIVQKLDRNAEN